MDSVHQLMALIGGESFAGLMVVAGVCVVLTIALSIHQYPREFFAALWRGLSLSAIFLGLLVLVAICIATLSGSGFATTMH